MKVINFKKVSTTRLKAIFREMRRCKCDWESTDRILAEKIDFELWNRKVIVLKDVFTNGVIFITTK